MNRTDTLRGLAALAASFVIFAALAACESKVSSEPGCAVGGHTYEPGQSFPAPDGCNTCTCGADGSYGCTKMACVVCEWDGQTHQPGESFPAGDGCNTCSCEPDGTVGCTLMWCASCQYAGVIYQPGDSFPALDGCNTCTCDDMGNVGCTELACPCDPEAEWWRDYVATDPETCMVIDYVCPTNTTMFGNACGCGCEQDPSCPEWFDCMPPAPCDMEKIKEECPYSGIAL